ncbi:hypothetical protein BHM03_00005460 [Ensete ventricosum]|nr:hypothetical protein BHM03_00005460 [Ensete ventricosum]
MVRAYRVYRAIRKVIPCGSSREGGIGSGSRKGFESRFSRFSFFFSLFFERLSFFLLPRRFFFPRRSQADTAL